MKWSWDLKKTMLSADSYAKQRRWRCRIFRYLLWSRQLIYPPLSMDKALQMANTLNIRHKYAQIGHPEFWICWRKHYQFWAVWLMIIPLLPKKNRNLSSSQWYINPFVISEDQKFVAIDGLWPNLFQLRKMGKICCRSIKKIYGHFSNRQGSPSSAFRPIVPSIVWDGKLRICSMIWAARICIWSTPREVKRKSERRSIRFTGLCRKSLRASNWLFIAPRPRQRLILSATYPR